MLSLQTDGRNLPVSTIWFLYALEMSLLFVVSGNEVCRGERNICDRFQIQPKRALAQERAQTFGM